ncbi:TPA: UDP-N-acetylglucosamine 2-epimerase (non-hydrolyzing) [Campylobacter lari]|nr:UDP-N-acetylglucosamine 2-epimerase (non-hydrolyzing) [Campylobacter lari]
MKTILFIIGTRPEAIKLAPLILEFKKKSECYNVLVCNTEQQKELSNQALSFFNIQTNISLDIMTENQNLCFLQAKILEKLQVIFQKNTIDATIVQGDTMSVFAGALSSFYNKVPVFHIEAGLRSYNTQEPFPEEAIRTMVSKIALLHFAPTQEAANALLAEKINKNNIYVCGNTGIDALYLLDKNTSEASQIFFKQLNINLTSENIVLITIHRRENHGARLFNIISAIKKIAQNFTTHKFIIPVHPNPNVKNYIYQELQQYANVLLVESLNYPHMVYILKCAKLILTDSGGLQEEGPSFKCPILILREQTERKEGVVAGFSKLVGTNSETIYNEAAKILILNKEATRINKKNPYGDGKASRKIEKIIRRFFK